MNLLRMPAFALGLMALSGCAAIALTLGSVAAGAGVDHTLRGIVYKTFASSLAETRLASLKTLKRMDMDVVKDEKTEEGWLISATAIERKIDIELEALSRRTTRVRVVANKGDIFFKDSATATEIIQQTAEVLDGS